jgi:outer membrane protein OmpA-like peptidoglycan-associated protein
MRNRKNLPAGEAPVLDKNAPDKQDPQTNLTWHGLATRSQATHAPADNDDRYEQEADDAASKVMQLSEPDSASIVNTGSSAQAALHGEGQPLPTSSRRFFEPRFGHDFGNVRIDASEAAGENARALNARAYTVDNQIGFAQGQYAPGTPRGDALLAHELAHTIQQGSRNQVRCRRLSGSSQAAEDELVKMRTAASTIQRAPDDQAFEEAAAGISERSAEKAFSTSSPGLVSTQGTGDTVLLMNFAIDGTDLKKEHVDFVRDLYFNTLTLDPMGSIEIIGFADSTGPEAHNNRLSKKRAQAVESQLRNLGAHNLRIKPPRFRGEREPISANNAVAGRARNRRVEIRLTAWKSPKPVDEHIKDLQKGMKPFIVKVENFSACPFKDMVRKTVEDSFKRVSTIQFDWDGKSASGEAFISFDDTTPFTSALGLTGEIFLNSFRNNEICKDPHDKSTCEKVFPDTADVMGRAIANTVAHETGHAMALDHVPATDNLMWSPELHPLSQKQNKTFADKVLLQRTLQSVPEAFNDSQLVHMINRIKEKRKPTPGLVEFE